MSASESACHGCFLARVVVGVVGDESNGEAAGSPIRDAASICGAFTRVRENLWSPLALRISCGADGNPIDRKLHPQ